MFLVTDLNFYPANYLKSLYWIGMSGSFIKLDTSQNKWKLIQPSSSIYAISDATETSLLLGNNNN